MKISEIRRQSRRFLKGKVLKSSGMLVYIFLSVLSLTAIPFLLNKIAYGNSLIIIPACIAVLLLNIFSYSAFFTGRSAWFLFYNKKKRSVKTLYWFSPARVSKSIGIYLSLFFKKIALIPAFLLPGAAIMISAVIIAMNGGVEFNMFVSWLAGGTVIMISGIIFLIIVLQRYFLVPYIKVEKPSMKTKEIFSLSRRIMNGNLKKAFLLKLSFVPLFLSCLTIFPIFYVWAYYNQSCAVMAENIQKRSGIIL